MNTPISSHRPELRISNSEQQFLKHCYTVIQEQQTYIEKLESDLLRKDSIINTMVGRKDPIHSASLQSNNAQLHLQINQLHHQVQHLSHRNQELRIENESKGEQICAFKLKVGQFEKRLEEGRSLLLAMKQAYEGKINKIMLEMRKSVQNRVMESKGSFGTPIKSTEEGKQMGGWKSRITTDRSSSTARRTLINTPYVQRSKQFKQSPSNPNIARTGFKTDGDEENQQEWCSDLARRSPLQPISNRQSEIKKLGLKVFLQELKAKMDNFSAAQ